MQDTSHGAGYKDQTLHLSLIKIVCLGMQSTEYGRYWEMGEGEVVNVVRAEVLVNVRLLWIHVILRMCCFTCLPPHLFPPSHLPAPPWKIHLWKKSLYHVTSLWDSCQSLLLGREGNTFSCTSTVINLLISFRVDLHGPEFYPLQTVLVFF